MTQLRAVESTIQYFPADGPRRVYPGTAGYQRRKFDSRRVQIEDIRGSEDKFTLDVNGFQVVTNQWSETKVGATDQQVKATVYPETIRMLKQMYVLRSWLVKVLLTSV